VATAISRAFREKTIDFTEMEERYTDTLQSQMKSVSTLVFVIQVA
jgi:hypothetical protein